MVRLGLFFPFLTDCWYPSRKPKCKNHSWPHRCPPPPPSPRVPARCGSSRRWALGSARWELGFLSWQGAARRSWSQPRSLAMGIYPRQQTPGRWTLVPGFQRSVLLPALRTSHLSPVTSPAGLGFFPPLSADWKIFTSVPGSFKLQILSAGFSFYGPFFWPPCTDCSEGEGRKAALRGWGSTAAPGFSAFPTSPPVLQGKFQVSVAKRVKRDV